MVREKGEAKPTEPEGPFSCLARLTRDERSAPLDPRDRQGRRPRSEAEPAQRQRPGATWCEKSEGRRPIPEGVAFSCLVGTGCDERSAPLDQRDRKAEGRAAKRSNAPRSVQGEGEAGPKARPRRMIRRNPQGEAAQRSGEKCNASEPGDVVREKRRPKADPRRGRVLVPRRTGRDERSAPLDQRDRKAEGRAAKRSKLGLTRPGSAFRRARGRVRAYPLFKYAFSDIGARPRRGRASSLNQSQTKKGRPRRPSLSRNGSPRRAGVSLPVLPKVLRLGYSPGPSARTVSAARETRKPDRRMVPSGRSRPTPPR